MLIYIFKTQFINAQFIKTQFINSCIKIASIDEINEIVSKCLKMILLKKAFDKIS